MLAVNKKLKIQLQWPKFEMLQCTTKIFNKLYECITYQWYVLIITKVEYFTEVIS